MWRHLWQIWHVKVKFEIYLRSCNICMWCHRKNGQDQYKGDFYKDSKTLNTIFVQCFVPKLWAKGWVFKFWWPWPWPLTFFSQNIILTWWWSCPVILIWFLPVVMTNSFYTRAQILKIRNYAIRSGSGSRSASASKNTRGKITPYLVYTFKSKSDM